MTRVRYTPYTYQEACQEFLLAHSEAGVFVRMGLGKTVMTLTVLERLIYDSFEVKKALVVAPLWVAQSVWPQECAKWTHLHRLRPVLVRGAPEERRRALAQDGDIYIINRENVVWLVEELKGKWPFDTLVLDELSSFKSPKAQRFRALRRVRKRITRVIGLTGTPNPNGLMDLWAECYLLDQGRALGPTLGGYRERYFTPDKRGPNVIYSWKPKPGAERAIYARLKDLCISLSGDVDLPPLYELPRYVKLPKAARKAYDRMERDTILRYPDADVDAGTAAILVNKLLQIAGGAVYDEDGGVKRIHDVKLEALDELIEAANGRPVLVAYSYRHELARLQARYPMARTIRGPGDIDAWNRGEIPVLLLHPASAGHGLNLQYGGETVIWFSLPWSLEAYQQTCKRLHRIGQARPVVVQLIVAEDTYDERVWQVLQDKDARQERLLEAVRLRIREVRDAS